MDGEGSIRVDIEELIQKLQDMKCDGYVTVEISIDAGDYPGDCQMELSAVDIESNDLVEYGSIEARTDEI